MSAEKIAAIVATVAILVLILSGYARGQGGTGRAVKMLGWGLLVAAGIMLTAYLIERFF